MVLIFDVNEHITLLKDRYKNPDDVLRSMIGYFLYRDYHLDIGIYDLPEKYRSEYSFYRHMFLLELQEVGRMIVDKSQYQGNVIIKNTDLWITLLPARIDNHAV